MMVFVDIAGKWVLLHAEYETFIACRTKEQLRLRLLAEKELR